MKKKIIKKKKVPSQELVIRVIPQDVPTVSELAEPMRDGKKLTIPKTWMSEGQLLQVVQGTPKKYIYTRPGKGGGMFQYVTAAYMTKALNYTFGWNWDFEILQHGLEGTQVWVMGKLTARGMHPGEVIVKTQFGRADIKFKKGTKEMLDFGNDLKAAASDALKKCASLLGFASDIYGKSEYKEETGRDPVRPAEEPVIQTQVVCHGPDGKGCKYGNDAEPLPEEIANYSTKIFGKPLCRECQKDAKPLKK